MKHIKNILFIGILGSAITASAQSTSASWVTAIQAYQCPGHITQIVPGWYETNYHNPTAATVAFDSMTDTYYYQTNNGRPFRYWTPRAVGISTNVHVETATATTTYYTNIFNSGKVTILYPCCNEAGGETFGVTDSWTASWGDPVTSTSDTNTWRLLMFGEGSRGFDHYVVSVEHRLRPDGPNTHYVETIERSNINCPSTYTPPARLDKIPNPLERSFLSVGSPNTFATLHTNRSLDTNWVLAVTFQYDGDGYACVPLTNWALPDDQCFFLLTTTNAP